MKDRFLIYLLVFLIFCIVFVLMPLLAAGANQIVPSFVNINGNILKAELAISDQEQETGLSGRLALAEDSAMLFVFNGEVIPTFWMKDMNFPIDIIWLDKNRRIVGISKNLQPENGRPTRLFAPQHPSAYALEIRAGFADKAGAKKGQKIAFSL